ncbi:SGNH/GDSL hydrolase family protein [Aestuariirhabdus sp. Z084]|uniref:SGNH/GDSL hydrolase family protein n=1 Tax=Aestuariirhabdus haliotis TaxID=2918751 RepID=UPI00201B454B|nr:SGNH/GDSL hydrolase family protein [Aestuariirhabdus haliotis]MCL6417477.1 SGNH/GDSL hydrolase family protein [Aestuariirhabdus haliotis]MCL6421437.1 SGNH/GDSL hydrolase family protein [Aestuariirhabdus haliotis]
MNKLFSATMMLALLSSPATAGMLTDYYTSFYSFGDSLTDDGKLGPGVLQAPSLNGRFSNGPTYAEHIEELFISSGLDTGNLALGGATAGDINANPAPPLNTFNGQIGVFQHSLATNTPLPTPPADPPKSAGPAPGTNPLVSVLFGGNDIFQGLDPLDAADDVTDGIRSIAAINRSLFDDFFVPNLPLGFDPVFGFSATLFNDQLANNISLLRLEGFNVIEFNTQAVFDELVDDIINGGTLFGITGAGPCRESFAIPGDSCLDAGIDPNTLLLNDRVHPNGVVHQVWGDRAIAAIETATVPTVGTLPLMLSVLIVLGFTRLRRRAQPIGVTKAPII